ncbi:hypothetical protein LguiA_029234 [Lonicera macranthoides]
MDPNPKPKKLLLQQQQQTLNLDDRISDLPDEILCHILSFLPTKYAAGTSTLSTRWKHIFAFIPKLSLDFDDSLLLNPDKDKDNNLTSLAIFALFVYSVMNVVYTNDLRIYSFSLKCQRDYDCIPHDGDSLVAMWVHLALSRKVRDLTVQVDNYNKDNDKDSILFPDQFFYCSSVMRVTISGCFFLDVPTVVFMPNLRSIFLDRVKFPNGEAVQSFIRGCLFLERVGLESCEFEELEVLEISSTKLKHLMVIDCKWDGEYEFALDVPNLEVLHYQADSIAYDYPVKNLSSVREAYLDIGISWDQLEDDASHYADTAVEFFAACSNVETLYLSQNSMPAIHWSSESIKPTFCNLTTLKLGINESGWSFLASLLESSPNLEVLGFTGGFTDCEVFPEFVSCVTKHEPQCLSSHLRKVMIQDFTGDEYELNVVEFFLKNAKVLREVEIDSNICLADDKKLSLISKCSPICEIVFTYTVEGKFDL